MIVGHIGGGQSDGYQVQRSLRFRNGAIPTLTRTFASGGNTKKWSFSCLLKVSTSSNFYLLGANYNTGTGMGFGISGGRIYYTVNATGDSFGPLLRDPTGYYHLMFVLDSAQTAAGDRFKAYVDGVQITFGTNLVTLNYDYDINGAVNHAIGSIQGVGTAADGNLSEVHFVNGQALTPSSFGEVSASSGQWQAKKYTGTYGTSGFYLDFSDPTSQTTLMADRSGNGNNWTANNISLTAGATYDSMLDVPLGSGGNERGNYATLNPLVKFDTGFITDGNLRYTPVGSGFATIPSTIPVPTSGKWYLGEFYTQYTTDPNNGMAYLLVPAGSPGISGAFPAAGSYGFTSSGSGALVVNGTPTFVGSLSVLTGMEIVRVTVDVDAGKVWFGRPTFWYDSAGGSTGDPATGVNPTFTFAPGGFLFAIETSVTNADRWHFANFGQRPFAHTPPAGFKVLHTDNLTNTTPVTSGSFTGNVSTNGPVIWCNGTPETLTINGNAVTWGTHADKTAGGFKLRTSSASYNSSGSNTWTATYLSPSSKSAFKYQLAKANP